MTYTKTPKPKVTYFRFGYILFRDTDVMGVWSNLKQLRRDAQRMVGLDDTCWDLATTTNLEFMRWSHTKNAQYRVVRYRVNSKEHLMHMVIEDVRKEAARVA
jgi:hypothetical protein